jgi:hypothetical protein
MGGGEDKREWWRGWIHYNILLRALVNVIMYPQNNNKKD